MNMGEGATLDFKQEQYPLANADDEQKSELVKDIVAFANAWKTSDAFILIGVKEQPGARATVHGVPHHHDDASLQQLVNSKTNVPVEFAYIPLSLDGKSVGVVRIAQHQQRPIFLEKRFGRLEKHVVYLRRGSSTDTALPDEVARMGAATARVPLEPSVQMEFGDPSAHRGMGTSVVVTSRVLAAQPTPELSPEMQRTIDSVTGAFSWVNEITPKITGSIFDAGPSDEQRIAYLKHRALLVQLGLVVHNTGTVLVEDARVVISVPKLDGLAIVDEYPEEPHGRFSTKSVTVPSDTCVFERSDHWELVVQIGKVQPGASVWSDPLWIGSSVSRCLALAARLYADNIPRAFETQLDIQIDTEEAALVDELLGDSDD